MPRSPERVDVFFERTIYLLALRPAGFRIAQLPVRH